MRERQKIILFWLSLLLLFCFCVVVVFFFFFFFFLGGGGSTVVCVCCFVVVVVVVWGGGWGEGGACSVTRHEVHFMQFGPGCLYDFSGWKQEKMRDSTVYPPSSRLPYQPQYALQVEYHH